LIRLLLACALLVSNSAQGQTLAEAKEAYKKANYIEATEAFEAIFARDGDGDALFMAGAARFAAGHMAHSIRHVEHWQTLEQAKRRATLEDRAKSLLEQARKATFTVKVVLPPDVVRDRKRPLKVRFTRNLGEVQVPALEWTMPVGWDAAPLDLRLDKGDWVAEVDLVGYRPSPQLQVIDEDSVITLLPEVAAPLLGDTVHIAVRLGFQEAVDLFRGNRFAEAVESCEALLTQAPGVEEIEWLKARALHLAGKKGHAYGAYARFLTLFPEASDVEAVKAALAALKTDADAELATVTIASTPPGGGVSIVDREGTAGKTPLVLKLYPGRYVFKVSLQGHDPVEQSFNVEPKGAHSVTVNLIRPPEPVTWRYGVVGGFGLGSPGGFDHPTITAEGGIRGTLGGYLTRRLSERLSVRAELRYTLDKMSLSDGERDETVLWTRHSMGIPLLAQFMLTDRLVVMGGPSLDVALAGTQTDDGDNTVDIAFATTVLAVEAGVGYALTGGQKPIRLDLRLGRTTSSLLDSGQQGLVLGQLRSTLDVSWAF